MSGSTTALPTEDRAVIYHLAPRAVGNAPLPGGALTVLDPLLLLPRCADVVEGEFRAGAVAGIDADGGDRMSGPEVVRAQFELVFVEISVGQERKRDLFLLVECG